MKHQLSKSFRVVIQPLSTRLINPNFCFHLSHRRSTTVSLETRNPFQSLALLFGKGLMLATSSFLSFYRANFCSSQCKCACLVVACAVAARLSVLARFSRKRGGTLTCCNPFICSGFIHHQCMGVTSCVMSFSII